ncbi:MFS transporter [Ktedonospora formicarum]|uniref:Permease n=1 Tax=Ktedonospora formicarum TaxID=2778364 RepID=A0A8J3MNR7_9CHLR|nr:MFS transporter [Ktedonospora formicarum]GHO43062.1 permease [Ktedonospora formicarum]
MSTNAVKRAKGDVGANKAQMDRRLVWIMAVACGLSVANLYYVQPVLADIGHEFTVSFDQVGILATLSQLGYALGLLLIVPLGDRYNRRTLIVTMLCAVTVALIAMATAPTLPLLAVSSFAIGVTTVVPQLLVPLAASMAYEHERGRVVGTVMSGLLIGILLARTVSGVVCANLGWRAMYWIAAGLMVLLALVLRFLLPPDRPRSDMSYPQLLRSLWSLLRSEPGLRETCVFGAMGFASFSAFWATLSFLLQTPPYHYGSEVAGLFGLVGVVGAVAASFVGRLADKMEARKTVGIALLVLLLSFGIFWLTGQFIWGLIIGVILLDLGAQSNQVSNQTRIYSLNPEARSRLNTIYMVSYFIGGSLGSFLGTYGWSIAGWSGVCAVSLLLITVAGIAYVINMRRALAR